MNSQEVPRQSRGDFPPEKFSAEIVPVLEHERYDWVTLACEPGDLSVELSILISLQPQIHKEPVRAVRSRRDNRFMRHRDKTGAFLSRAFRKELFRP